MKMHVLITSLAASLLLGVASPLLAAEARSATTSGAAGKCLSDLSAFDSQMRKDGYWLTDYGDTYAFGYPLSYAGDVASLSAESPSIYVAARSGYELRALLSAADILARHGQQQACEDVVASARDHYQWYIDEMEAAHMPMANVPGWQRRQIAAAEPVTRLTTSFRSDQLLGTDVRNPQNKALGSVDDLVTNPQTGRIAYLVIARGGWLFGIGAKSVAVPWNDVAIAPNATLVVLAANRSDMEGAPQVNAKDLTTSAQQRQKVDAYWKAHIPSPAAN